MEDKGFEKGPDGECGGGVEVAVDIPVAELEVADGAVPVPAFVSVFGPIHPARVIGEVGGQMDGVQPQQDGRTEEHDGVQGSG